MEKMSFVASMPPGMVSEFTRRYLNHIHVRSLATLFKPCTEEELEGTLAKPARVEDGYSGSTCGDEEPERGADLSSASHHILASVFTQCFEEDFEDVGFVAPSERSLHYVTDAAPGRFPDFSFERATHSVSLGVACVRSILAPMKRKTFALLAPRCSPLLWRKPLGIGIASSP